MNNKLGHFIREKRGEMSLREFAKLCNMSHTHLDSIEKGYDPRTKKAVSVSLDTLIKLSNGTGIPTDYLVDLMVKDEISQKSEGKKNTIPIKPERKQTPDLAKFLDQAEVMFDGELYNLDNEDKQKVRDALEYAFWHAKQKNKRKK